MSTLLFVPATEEKKFAKASLLPCSGIIVDLEDAVAVEDKERARQSLRALIPYRNLRKRLWIRINSVDTPWWREDLQAAVSIRPDVIVLPKAGTEEDVLAVDQYMAELEQENGIEKGSIRLELLIETARGLVDMERVLGASPRVMCATIGMADLCTDLGITWEDAYASPPDLFLSERLRLSMLSKKLGLQPPYDSVYMKIHDADGLRRDTVIGKRLGCQGKHVIHPNQIHVVNEVYQVSEEEYRRALHIVEEYERARGTGHGALQVDGLLVDAPVVQRARRLVERFELQRHEQE